MSQKNKGYLMRSLRNVVLSAGIGLTAKTAAYAANSSSDQPSTAPSSPINTFENALSNINTDPSQQNGQTMNNDLDRYFNTQFRVHSANRGLWVTEPNTCDTHFLKDMNGSLFQPTREYIQVAPLHWDWLGQASGFQYNVQFNVGPGLRTGSLDWVFTSGLNFAYYQSLSSPYTDGNKEDGAFLQAATELHIARLPTRLILNTSFNQISGPDIGRGQGEQVLAELDFPRLFNTHGIHTGDPSLDDYRIGKYSGMVNVFANTANDYGGKAGIYYNHLTGKLRYNVGPEVSYDKISGLKGNVAARFSFGNW